MSLARDIADLGAVTTRLDTVGASSGALSNRNLIINGAMQVAQRGTSVTGSTASAILTVDRFQTHASGATYDSLQQSVTLGGETGLPVQFKNYFKFNVTTGANNCAVWQTVEDVTKVQGTHTLSFYAKGVNPAGGSIDFTTRQDFGSGGSTAADVLVGNFVLTSTWQRFTFTFDVASVAGKTIGASSYFRAMFHQPNGDSGSAAWNLQITGLQLEVGSEATPFEHRSYDDELSKCQRYFQAWGAVHAFASGVWFNSTQVLAHMPYIKEMRAAPTFTTSGNDFAKVYKSGGTIQVSDSTPFDVINTTSARVNVGFGTSGTSGEGAYIQTESGAYIHVEAEI
tara:strand:+ start:189 stop:1208 length:1020 start_codon:yes stop_codon:yes gene_type:complete